MVYGRSRRVVVVPGEDHQTRIGVVLEVPCIFSRSTTYLLVRFVSDDRPE